MTSLFIGVVSHEGSRFAANQGTSGLAQCLVAPLGGLGVTSSVHVNTQDMFDASAHPITVGAVQAALSAELALDRQWAIFLQRTGQPRWWITHLLQAVRRTSRRLQSPSPETVVRLLNIELSHLDLMRRAIDVGTDWLLLLEDDGAAADVDDCARGLAGIMRHEGAPAYVNVSASFPLDTLGVQHLVREVPDARWQGSHPRRLLESAKPITNTVCAILYRRAFLVTLFDALEAIPLEPVLPIDWKLNRALMDLWDAGLLSPGDCWTVDPAPIKQLSMSAVG